MSADTPAETEWVPDETCTVCKGSGIVTYATPHTPSEPCLCMQPRLSNTGRSPLIEHRAAAARAEPVAWADQVILEFARRRYETTRCAGMLSCSSCPPWAELSEESRRGWAEDHNAEHLRSALYAHPDPQVAALTEADGEADGLRDLLVAWEARYTVVLAERDAMQRRAEAAEKDWLAATAAQGSLSAALEEAKVDAERLDWMQQRVAGTGETMQFGGVCYWGIEIVKGRRSKPVRIGEGDDLRDAVDDAMGATIEVGE